MLFQGSIIHYAREDDLKRELNEQFRAMHPGLHPSIMLSHIRSLKQRLLRISFAAGLELSTVAKTFVYFEKLVLDGQAAKFNRKLIAACCLLLSCKTNDSKDTDCHTVLRVTSKALGVPVSEIIRFEWPVFAALHFDLHVKQDEYLPHLDRILEGQVEIANIKDYIGVRMYRVWKRGLREQISDDEEDEEEGD